MYVILWQATVQALDIWHLILVTLPLVMAPVMTWIADR